MSQLQSMVIALVVIGVMIGVGMKVLENLKTNVSNTGSTSDSWAVNNVTAHTFDQTTGIYTSLAVTNGTDSINSGNYTLTDSTILGVRYLSTIVATLDGNTTYGSDTWTLTYDYEARGNSWVGVNDTITATNEIPEWLSLIIIVAIAGIILALIFRVFPKGGGVKGTEMGPEPTAY